MPPQTLKHLGFHLDFQRGLFNIPPPIGRPRRVTVTVRSNAGQIPSEGYQSEITEYQYKELIIFPVAGFYPAVSCSEIPYSVPKHYCVPLWLLLYVIIRLTRVISMRRVVEKCVHKPTPVSMVSDDLAINHPYSRHMLVRVSACGGRSGSVACPFDCSSPFPKSTHRSI
jgi:hypothetical protein